MDSPISSHSPYSPILLDIPVSLNLFVTPESPILPDSANTQDSFIAWAKVGGRILPKAEILRRKRNPFNVMGKTPHFQTNI